MRHAKRLGEGYRALQITPGEGGALLPPDGLDGMVFEQALCHTGMLSISMVVTGQRPHVGQSKLSEQHREAFVGRADCLPIATVRGQLC